MDELNLEDLYEKFLNILQFQMNRTPAEFQFIAGIESRRTNFLYKIDKYLESTEIPFFALGVSLNSETLLPVMENINEDYEDEITLPSGLFSFTPKPIKR